MSEDTEQVGNSSDGDSQSSKESQQSPDLAAIQRRLDELGAQFKGLQKGTDKVNNRVEKQVNQVLSNTNLGRIIELAKSGKSAEEIEESILLADILAERKANASGSQAVGNGKGSDGVNEGAILSQLVSAFGLDANDKTVAEALSKSDLNGLVAVAKSKLSAPEADSTTQMPLTSKEKVSVDANKKALQSAYEKELGELQKQANGRRISPATLANLKLAYRKKGLTDLH